MGTFLHKISSQVIQIILKKYFFCLNSYDIEQEVEH